jgi:iron complex outermembrane receptor protein
VKLFMKLMGAAAVAAGMASSMAVAQVVTIEEVVVTATKREQTLQGVPVAVSVTSAAVLERAQIHDLIDLQSVVPSLRVTQEQTSTQTNFEIRGFGNGANNPGIEPSVGVFVDGVYRSRSASQIGDMLDVERVEVLRGPQSTLFGQNASAGVISIVSKKPSFDFGGEAEVGFGNYSSKLAKVRLTGPISDTLAFSLSGIYNQRDGYFDNLAGGPKLNDRDRWNVQGQLLWKASEHFTARLLADVSSITEVCCAVSNLYNGPTGGIIQAIGGNLYTGSPYDRRGYFDVTPTNKVDNNGVSLHLDWDLDAVRFTSITAYRDQKLKYLFDVDFTSARLASDPTDSHIHTFTQEFRLASNKDGPLEWMLGGYYFDEAVHYQNSVVEGADFRNYANYLIGALGGSPNTLAGLESALGLPVGTTFFGAGQSLGIDAEQKAKSLTFFGQLDWKITDSFKATLGLAHTSAKKDINFASSDTDVFSSLNLVNIGFGLLQAGGYPAALADRGSVTYCPGGPPYPASLCNPLLPLHQLQFLPPVIPYSDSSNDADTTYTARLSWNPVEHVTVYGGVSTGFKATSWNLSINSAPVAPGTPDPSPLGCCTVPQNDGNYNGFLTTYGTRAAGPEKSTAYELGFKGKWPTVLLNVAVFDQIIKGFQSNVFTGTGFNLANAGKQSAKGVEIETQWKPTASWEFGISGTFMDPKYDSFVGAACVGGTCDLSGARPGGIHRTSIASSATYFWSASRLNGFVRLSHIYEDEVQSIDNVPESIATQKVSTLNASTGVSVGGWTATLWCTNLNNDTYLLLAFPSVAQRGSYSGYPNAPRMFGLNLATKF